MEIKQYILAQAPARQDLLTKIHQMVTESDNGVTAQVELMMGKEMIVYKGKNMMKYGLASVKNYMSLHVMPIYGSKRLYDKYKALLNKANFQKGCINFNNENEMPVDIVRQLIIDCSSVDLTKIKEEYLQSKKK